MQTWPYIAYERRASTNAKGYSRFYILLAQISNSVLLGLTSLSNSSSKPLSRLFYLFYFRSFVIRATHKELVYTV